MGKNNRGPGLQHISTAREDQHCEEVMEVDRMHGWEGMNLSDYGYEGPSGVCPSHDPAQPSLKVDPRESEAKRAVTAANNPIRLVVAPASKTKRRRFLQQRELSTTNHQKPRDNDVEPTLSRKERKRRAAKLHAATHELFCDTVVQHGPVMDHELVVPDFVAKPLANIPADIVAEVLLPYLPCRDILALMSASVGVNTVLKNDDSVWEHLFRVQQRSPQADRRWVSLRNRRRQEIGKRVPWSDVVRYVNDLHATENQDRAAKQTMLREQSFDSDGARAARQALQAKTSLWETQDIMVYVRKADGKCFPFSPPLVKQYLGYNRLSYKPDPRPPRYTWVTRNATFRWQLEPYPDVCTNHGPVFTYERGSHYDYNTKITRRSEAFAKQYQCAHRAVVLDTTRHWFRCLDCHVYTHATFTAPGIWHEDNSDFWHEDE